MRSCYIHIPFCNSICSYCDFPKVCYNRTWVMPYLDALKEEINSVYLNDKISTLYIGGGTPTSLSILELTYLFDILSVLDLSCLSEFTIEGNVSDITLEKINLFKKYGVNRVSLGVESFDLDNLKILNRKINYDDVKEKVELLKSNGISNINLDLMYAITPSIEALKNDLDKFISLDVPHISTYSLILEDNTLLKINGFNYIDEDIDSSMYKLICNTLKEKGYNHYEISNFSYPGYESVHNMTYWKNKEYYGFGLGASSYIKNRYTNTRSLTKYINHSFISSIEYLDLKSIEEYEFILNLRLKNGLNIKEYEKKFNKSFDYSKVNDLILKGLVVIEGDNLFIPEDKFYLSNEILVKFIDN